MKRNFKVDCLLDFKGVPFHQGSHHSNNKQADNSCNFLFKL